MSQTRITIDLLSRMVDKQDEKDGRAEELWDGVQCEPSHVESFDPAVERQGIRRMEGLLVGPQSFVSSKYDSHISATQIRGGVNRITPENLPNELILRVLEDVYDHWDLASLVRYSNISSRFRTVIWGSPSLWATVPLKLGMSIRHIETIALRSATLGLTVDIMIGIYTQTNESESAFYIATTSGYRPVDSTSILATLTKLFDYCHRWRNVKIAVENENAAQFIQQHFPRVTLTSIRTLHVDSAAYWQIKTSISENWEMPQLKNLYWGFACICLPSCVATQMLRVCTVFISESQWMGISAFLSAATNLTSLKLSLSLTSEQDSDIADPAELPLTRLPCLEHLELNDFCHPRSGATAQFLKAVVCPGLNHLSFPPNTLAAYHDLTENMRERYPFLHSVTLDIGWDDDKEHIVDIDELLCSLPGTIQKVQLKGGYRVKLHASRTISCTPLPNLKELDLYHCAAREESFFADLSDTLESLGVSLNCFRPCRLSFVFTETEKDNAKTTLRRAGVLDDLNLTS